MFTVKCRFGDECKYEASGDQEFVEANYRTHLREDHGIRHARVEPEEIRTC